MLALTFTFLLAGLTPAQLSAGDVQITGGSLGTELRAIGLIKAPPSTVYALVTQCQKYGGLMPRIAKSKLVSERGLTRSCAMEVDMPFPLGDLKTVLAQTRSDKPGTWRVDWKQVKGGYEQNAGSWRMSAYGPDGQWTLVDYRLALRLKGWVPAWIQDLGAKGSIKPMFKNLRARLEK